MQREEPFGAGGRTHGIRHQADVRLGHLRWPERQLYEGRYAWWLATGAVRCGRRPGARTVDDNERIGTARIGKVGVEPVGADVAASAAGLLQAVTMR